MCALLQAKWIISLKMCLLNKQNYSPQPHHPSHALFVGITGGMGSGKTYVSEFFKKRGYSIFNCDQEAKQEILENSELQAALAKLIGSPVTQTVTQESQQQTFLLKSVLSKYIQQGPQWAEKINQLVHPAVWARYLRWQANTPDALAFMESAILYESGFAERMDCVIAVTAPLEVRIRRIQARDGKSEAEIRNWLAVQMSAQKLELRADFVIDNSGTKNLDLQVENIITQLKQQKPTPKQQTYKAK